jgi:hypothetical protein
LSGHIPFINTLFIIGLTSLAPAFVKAMTLVLCRSAPPVADACRDLLCGGCAAFIFTALGADGTAQDRSLQFGQNLRLFLYFAITYNSVISSLFYLF